MFPSDFLANNPKLNQQLFYGEGNNNSTVNWARWIKPEGKSMAYILAIGPGGNGGTPTSSTTTGGGGGGSAGISSLLIPTFYLPDTLSIQVGKHSATSGGNGNNTFVSLQNTSTVNFSLLVAGAGGGGTAGGTGGSAGSAATVSSSCKLASAGFFQSFGGVGGGAGGALATGANVTALSSTILSGGAGGGGGGNNGGNITGGGLIPTILGGAGSVTVAGSPGFPGITLIGGPNGFMACGGSGGGSTTVAADVGGAGGNGGIGCGGGGGGSSTLSTGGTFGLGGDGFVGIWCF